jgi:hypothetical protein
VSEVACSATCAANDSACKTACRLIGYNACIHSCKQSGYTQCRTGSVDQYDTTGHTQHMCYQSECNIYHTYDEISCGSHCDCSDHNRDL